MLNPTLKSINLSKDEYKKYARHLIMDRIGIHGQKRLKQAKILFIGVGGLASSAIIYLAALGIGHLGIIDDDIVSESNLHRQILYTSKDLNKLKIDCAKSKIYQINPECKVNTYNSKLNINNCIDLIKNYDIIIDTCDNFTTRYIIDFACHKLHKIHIYGAIENFEGQVSVFNYKGGPLYSDLYPEYLNLKNKNNCNNIGVLGIIPGIIGLLQATEAIKIILGTGEILSGYILIYDSINILFNKVKISSAVIKKENFNYNNRAFIQNKNNTISYKQLIYMLDYSNIILIDVRQNIEFIKSHIKKSINIPVKYMKNKKTLEFVHKACSNKLTIIYCSNNSRAIIASQILYKNNINHQRLKDGFNI